jgi:hypothetical protein
MEQKDFDETVKRLMFDIVLVLYNYGIKEINLGALMRLLGVDPETALAHDNDTLEITGEFAKYVMEMRDTSRSDNETLH